MSMLKNKFGFDLMVSRDLPLSGAWTPEVADFQKAEPSMMRCITCGSCAASCVSSNKVSIARAILLIRRGLIFEACNTVDGCLFCGKCRFVCPMGVNTRGFVAALRQIKN